MDVVEKKLKLDRRGLVTMALLCGCVSVSNFQLSTCLVDPYLVLDTTL
jgi:hypothetical protein